jgi:hypothetical protein
MDSHGLTLIRNLQDTAFKTVDLMQDAAGEQSVLKYCKTHCPSLALEKDVLVAVNAQSSTYLTFPKLLGYETDYLLMSFVEREDQTRDTISKRNWTRRDVEVLSSGMREFSSLPMPSSIYTLKQKVMGLAYPAFKMFLSVPKLLKRRCLSFSAVLKLAFFALRYCLHRPFIRNRTTHYDMTTLNCAFSGEDRLSILDLELGYAGGDPFFDICYFLTIPPVALKDWTFQQQTLSHFVNGTDEHAVQFRMRFILSVCCVSRLLHFKNDSKEHRAYKDSIETLLNRSQFNKWWSEIVQAQT